MYDQTHLKKVYMELCEFIHTRFHPQRPDNPQLRKSIITTEEIEAQKMGIKRVPSELERRFFDIVFLIVQDHWEVPGADEWLKIVEQIGAFAENSELVNDNCLGDTHEFFKEAARLLGFTRQYAERYRELGLEYVY